jgi:hypothetical protein
MCIFFGSNGPEIVNKKVLSQHSYCFVRGGSISEKLPWNMSAECGSAKANRELLFALERARTRLAIAIATESKSTTLDRWQYYLDTAERMGRFVKRLRKADIDTGRELKDYTRALQALKRLSVQDTALQLCRILGAIVAELE